MHINHRSIHKPNAGFTIVELLIVIVVIGVLAAISVVAYNGISNKANDAAVQSDIAQIVKKMQLYHAENGKHIDVETISQVKELGIGASKGSYGAHYEIDGKYNLLICVTADRQLFAVAAASKSGRRFTYNTDGKYGDDEQSLVSRATLCPELGVPNGGGSQSSWMYSSNNWQI